MLKKSLIIFFLAGVAFASQTVFAQNQSLEFSGLAISPFLIEAELQPGGSVDEVITLTNTTNQIIGYDISINDFIPDEKTGQAKFLPTDQDSDPKFSLSSWIEITSQPNFSLKPQAQTQVKFRISPPKEVELGTHYGGILFVPRISTNNASGPKVVQKVGAIILAKIGRAREQGRIADFYRDGNNFKVEFHNFGNVHLKPKGEIYIYNMFGAQVGDLYVNKDAEIVLPETQREFQASWSPSWLNFGRFTATTILYFGNPKLETRNTISFWILPIKQVLILLILILILAFLSYRSIQRYNAWLIRRSKSKH